MKRIFRAPWLAAVIALLAATPAGAQITIGGITFRDDAFTDNALVNGPGNDLAIFTLFAARPINVFLSLPGSVHRATLPTSFTGTTNASGAPANVALLDLDGLLAPGATLDRVMIAGGDETGVDAPNQLAAVGALNAVAVPDPATVALVGFWVLALLGGHGLTQRRRAGTRVV
jgi:hypothetical protein